MTTTNNINENNRKDSLEEINKLLQDIRDRTNVKLNLTKANVTSDEKIARHKPQEEERELEHFGITNWYHNADKTTKNHDQIKNRSNQDQGIKNQKEEELEKFGQICEKDEDDNTDDKQEHLSGNQEECFKQTYRFDKPQLDRRNTPLGNRPSFKTSNKTWNNFTKSSNQGFNFEALRKALKPENKDVFSFKTKIGKSEGPTIKVPKLTEIATTNVQEIMENLLGHLEFITIFMDDVLIASLDIDEHLRHIKSVLTILRDAGAKINFEKSTFGTTEIKFLGCFIDQYGLRADTSQIAKLKSNPPPDTLKGLRKLIGVFNWFREFVPNLSVKIQQLTDKLKNGPSKKIEWTLKDEECRQNIFKDIEKNIILHHIDFNKNFDLFTDASERGIGAVLLQENKVVGLYSKKLINSEQNYTICEKELYAIIKALEHFRELVWASKIKIFTDSRNITFNSNKNNRMNRWKAILNDFEYEVNHIEGKTNIGADYLSRFCVLKEEQEQAKLTLSASDEIKYLRNLHESIVHAGIERTVATARELVSIKNLKDKVTDIVLNCHDCAVAKRDYRRLGLTQGHLSTTEPLKDICADVFGPVNTIHQGKEKRRYILVIIDRFSRIAMFRRIVGLSHTEVIRILKIWIFRYGIPNTLLTDNGTNFVAKETKEFCNKLQIKNKYVTVNNPQGNGICERVNQVLKLAFKIRDGDEIEEILKWVEKGYNNAYHGAIGTTPYRVLTGRSEIALNAPFKRIDLDEVRNRLSKKSQANNLQLNKGRREYQYSNGDCVYIKTRDQSKTGLLFEGPFFISNTDANGNWIEVLHKGKTMRVNVKNVKLRGGVRCDNHHIGIAKVADLTY